jgi:hypothetical protein
VTNRARKSIAYSCLQPSKTYWDSGVKDKPKTFKRSADLTRHENVADGLTRIYEILLDNSDKQRQVVHDTGSSINLISQNLAHKLVPKNKLPAVSTQTTRDHVRIYHHGTRTKKNTNYTSRCLLSTILNQCDHSGTRYLHCSPF